VAQNAPTAAGNGAPSPAPDALRLDRSLPLPLWAQLLDDLRRRLGAGEFRDAFPGELELAARYGVSRNTVREAMRRLRDEGTVEAGRGRRPSLSHEIRQPLGSPYSLYDSIEAAGLDQRALVRRADIVTDATVARHLGGDGSLALVHIERLRFADDVPLALDWIWLPAEIAAPLLDADLTDRGLYEELALRTGLRLTGGSEHLRAVIPSVQERADLALPRGAAAFSIERLGLVGRRAVEWRRTLIRGDRFSVVAQFTGRSGAPGGRDLLAGSVPLAEPARPARA
jgi:GntR family transcriptional regulator